MFPVVRTSDGIRVAFSLLACAAFYCLFPSDARGQYRFDQWTTANGLPHNAVVSIRQTRDGYIWLATKDGLVRYDGVRFTVFNSGNTPGISTNRLRILLEDRHGTLWIGTEDGGLIRYKDRAFTSYTTRDGLPSDDVLGLQEGAEGNLWVITHSGIVEWNDGPVRVASIPESASVNVQQILLGAASRALRCGGFWYPDAEGVHRFERGRWTTYGLEDGLPNLNVVSVYEDSRGAVWFLLFDGRLCRFQNGRASVQETGFSFPPYAGAVVLARAHVRDRRDRRVALA
jgi:ligand-binding sensor domain-containing protein